MAVSSLPASRRVPQPLTLDEKCEITRRLGYRLEREEGAQRGALIDPDGRHKGLFMACKATDVWTWNDAVFRCKLSRHRDGGVYRRLDETPDAPGCGRYEHVWPGERAVETLKRDSLEDLGGSSRAA